MIKGIRYDLQTYVSNLKAGDWDTWWMTAVVGISLYCIYAIITTPC